MELRRRVAGLDIPEERLLAGRLAGCLYLVAALTTPALLVLPYVERVRADVLLVAAALALLWGFACLTVVPWQRASPLVSHASTVCGFPLAGCAVAASGGAESPARFYLLFVLVYASYFYRPREAWPYVAGCVLTMAAPVVYDADALRSGFVAELAIAGPCFVILGGLLISGKRVLVALREQADDLAQRDPLTGLCNRRALMDALERIAGSGRRDGDRAGLVLLDIDDLKRVNTDFGHQGGDAVLRAAAAALRTTARECDVVARLGGDEFAVVVPGAGPAQMRVLTERLLEAVRRADAGPSAPRITASAGSACLPDDAVGADGLVAVADRVLRSAKLVGKDRAGERFAVAV